jgi:hypothetical protein
MAKLSYFIDIYNSYDIFGNGNQYERKTIMRVRKIVCIPGELELWAYVPKRQDFIAADGQTMTEAASKLMEEHPAYFDGQLTEVTLRPSGVLPPRVRVTGRYVDAHGNPADP